MQYLEGEHESLNWFRHPNRENGLVQTFEVKQYWTDTDNPVLSNYSNKIELDSSFNRHEMTRILQPKMTPHFIAGDFQSLRLDLNLQQDLTEARLCVLQLLKIYHALLTKRSEPIWRYPMRQGAFDFVRLVLPAINRAKDEAAI